METRARYTVFVSMAVVAAIALETTHCDYLSHSHDHGGSTLSVAIVGSFCDFWLTRELRRTIHGVVPYSVVSARCGGKTGSSGR